MDSKVVSPPGSLPEGSVVPAGLDARTKLIARTIRQFVPGMPPSLPAITPAQHEVLRYDLAREFAWALRGALGFESADFMHACGCMDATNPFRTITPQP